MIDYISIKNFRCFEETQISGFGQVNLIGGLNNSGKTALLEALLLAFSPTVESFEVIRELRNETFEKKPLLNPWRYLFYNQNEIEEIKILIKGKEDKDDSHLNIFHSQDIDVILKKNPLLKEDRLSRIFGESSNFFFLNLLGKNQGKEFGYIPILKGQRREISMGIMFADHIGTTLKRVESTNFSTFLHSSLRMSDIKLAILHGLAKDNGKIPQLNNLLNKLDKRIIKSETHTLSDGTSFVRLILDNDQKLPIKMFGDAVRKAVEIMLVLLNTSNSALFIDEIENGLHYTKQAEFWKALFQIAYDQKVQIFATTHSKEMIRAFANIATEKKTDVSGMYFQMYRSALSGQIVAAPYEVAELTYALKKNIPLRGETE